MEIRKPPYAGYANCVDFWSWLEGLPPEPPLPPPNPGELRAVVLKRCSIFRVKRKESPVIGHLERGQVVNIKEETDTPLIDWVSLVSGGYVMKQNKGKKNLRVL
jgi:hypothetical protein